jgi:hypothetical protein
MWTRRLIDRMVAAEAKHVSAQAAE